MPSSAHGAASAALGGAPRASPALSRPGAAAARSARTPALRVAAFARGHAPPVGPAGSWHNGTYERVLRYPDGRERRIRYPLPPAEEPSSEDLTDGCWADTCWVPRAAWLGMASAADGGAVLAAAPAGPQQQQQPAAFAPDKPAEPERSRMPSSPMELLRYLNSPEYQAAQAEQWARVRGSYEVLDQVPWVAPKPLYLLAVEQGPPAGGGHPRGGEPRPGLGYSLRTRVARADTEDELSRVLRRRAPDALPLIRCSEMRDGVVAFEDEADAERYGQMLEADGMAEVSIARCDSHELFRSVQDTRGVVVLLRRGGSFLPQPHQLSTSLRSQSDGSEGDGSSSPLLD
ncbi:hypothetical protein C2E20_7868 [Micractinium conductrix]|uniref:Uncharacterized protein n=1 Tax=Micractinium conductrix TaxID=554055 RepID=A0A2P6V384_9CHLO|nr:hypothetical protein C2E20_7868 [Micractinium conductrix]|eukprot:PSC68534.1 hypothetical protein C2E20_7868 [Micractinium conductrix]